MKPLKLEVFPGVVEETPLCIIANSPNVGRRMGYVVEGKVRSMLRVICDAEEKRLTATELAAEYHQQAAYTTYWEHRTTAAHHATNMDRLDTLRRFATLEHAGDEQ